MNQWNEFLRSNKGKYKTILEASLAYKFNKIEGDTFESVVKRIPGNANKRYLDPQLGKVTQGVEYKWKNRQNQTIRIRVHGPDPSAPIGSNAHNGWIVRIQLSSKWLGVDGKFYHRNSHNPQSPHFDALAANDTHIPILAPTNPI
jgi:Bacterial toxin 30